MGKRLTDAEIERQLDAAEARDAAQRARGLRASAVRYDKPTHRFMLELINHYLIGIPVDTLPHLAGATTAQLAAVEVGPQGGALLVPALDADYSVPGLIFAMTASEIGRRGGQASTNRKQSASRANGAKGGRPRKAATARTKRG